MKRKRVFAPALAIVLALAFLIICGPTILFGIMTLLACHGPNPCR